MNYPYMVTSVFYLHLFNIRIYIYVCVCVCIRNIKLSLVYYISVRTIKDIGMNLKYFTFPSIVKRMQAL